MYHTSVYPTLFVRKDHAYLKYKINGNYYNPEEIEKLHIMICDFMSYERVSCQDGSPYSKLNDIRGRSLRFRPHGQGGFYSPGLIPFYDDWNWILPVAKKIKETVKNELYLNIEKAILDFNVGLVWELSIKIIKEYESTI